MMSFLIPYELQPNLPSLCSDKCFVFSQLINQQKKGGGPVSGANYGAGKKSLGTR